MVVAVLALTAPVLVGRVRPGRSDAVVPAPMPGEVVMPAGVQFRYRRASGNEWVPASVSATQLRKRGLNAWPAAVGVWWPGAGGPGVMVCRPCVEEHPAAAVAQRLPDDVALVLVGVGALQRVERRCVVHTGRSWS